LKNRWWTPSEPKNCFSKASGGCPGIGPLEIAHFQGPILFLAFTLVVALILSLLELIFKAWFKTEAGLTPDEIFGRDLKEGCCGCFSQSGSTTIEDREDR